MWFAIVVFKTNCMLDPTPTTVSSDDEIDNFYQRLNETLQMIPRIVITVICGDFNPKSEEHSVMNISKLLLVNMELSTLHHIRELCNSTSLGDKIKIKWTVLL